MDFTPHFKLSPFTSWQIGGLADWYCLPETEDDLVAAVRFAHERNLPWTVLGGGSNVLVSDEGIEGLVIGLRKFNKIEITEESGRLSLECQAGVGKSELLKAFLKHKLPPAEFLAGLPGDVGGGIVMNAGVAESLKPREFCEIVDWFEVLRWENEGPRFYRWNRNEVQWAYRHSLGWQPGTIVS